MKQEGGDDVCRVYEEEIQLNYTRLNAFLIMQLHFLMWLPAFVQDHEEVSSDRGAASASTMCYSTAYQQNNTMKLWQEGKWQTHNLQQATDSSQSADVNHIFVWFSLKGLIISHSNKTQGGQF